MDEEKGGGDKNRKAWLDLAVQMLSHRALVSQIDAYEIHCWKEIKILTHVQKNLTVQPW